MPLPTRHLAAALGLAHGLMLCGIGVVRAADVSIVGTGDGIEIIRSIAMAYSATRASARIIVPPSIGSRSAIAAVGGGYEVLGRVTGTLSATEQALGLTMRPLARLPIAVITHRDVGLAGMRSVQLADILSGKMANWKQAGGPDLRVKVVTPDQNDHVWLTLQQAIPGLQGIELSARAKIATSGQDILETVRTTPGAIGVIPYSQPYAHVVTALAVDEKHPSNKDYPAMITLGIVYRTASLPIEAADFIAFADSTEGRVIVARFGAEPMGGQ